MCAQTGPAQADRDHPFPERGDVGHGPGNSAGIRMQRPSRASCNIARYRSRSDSPEPGGLIPGSSSRASRSWPVCVGPLGDVEDRDLVSFVVDSVERGRCPSSTRYAGERADQLSPDTPWFFECGPVMNSMTAAATASGSSSAIARAAERATTSSNGISSAPGTKRSDRLGVPGRRRRRSPRSQQSEAAPSWPCPTRPPGSPRVPRGPQDS
jgi:hypothetical protein